MAKNDKLLIFISGPYAARAVNTADLVSGCSIIDKPQGTFFGRNKMTNFKISLPPPFVDVVAVVIVVIIIDAVGPVPY